MTREEKKKPGICLMNQRGQIGDHWWSQQWLKVFDDGPSKSEQEAARNAARRGIVTRLEITPGQIKAMAEDSRTPLCEVIIEFDVVPTAVWDEAFALLQRTALYSAELFSGQLSEELSGKFAEIGLSLMPKENEPRIVKGLGEEDRIGKAALATAYITAERMDSDPFLLLRLHGEGRREILRRFRKSWGLPEELGFDPSAPQPLEASLTQFYELPLHVVNTEDVEETTEDLLAGYVEELPGAAPARHDSHVLSRLGFPPFFPVSERNIVQTLRGLYEEL